VARWVDDLADLAALLDRADHALYQAKAAGRNCIRIA
jgi:PleD family two-component response regulator